MNVHRMIRLSSNAPSLAQLHYQHMQDYLQERGLLDENRDEGQVDSCSLPSTARMTIPMEHQGSFIPYLCEQVFSINEHVLTLPVVSDVVVGSMMVSNLALVHQYAPECALPSTTNNVATATGTSQQLWRVMLGKWRWQVYAHVHGALVAGSQDQPVLLGWQQQCNDSHGGKGSFRHVLQYQLHSNPSP
jgi:hypothetical protein